MQRRRMLRAGAMTLAALAALSIGRRSHAARDGVMRILCSGPAGSIPDLVARAVGEQLLATLGQRTLIDNRPGAAGQISVSALKAAPADGLTLLLAQGAIATVYPFLYAKLGYDPALDLQPVSLASEMSLGLAVGPAVPREVATLADFIDWARRHPAAANVGSPGTGTLPHLLEAMRVPRSRCRLAAHRVFGRTPRGYRFAGRADCRASQTVRMATRTNPGQCSSMSESQ